MPIINVLLSLFSGYLHLAIKYLIDGNAILPTSSLSRPSCLSSVSIVCYLRNVVNKLATCSHFTSYRILPFSCDLLQPLSCCSMGRFYRVYTSFSLSALPSVLHL